MPLRLVERAPDAPEVVSLFSRWLIELRGALRQPIPDAAAVTNPAEYRDDRGMFLVAFDQGRAVGCGGMRLLDGERGEVKRLFVDEAWRGQAVARTLLDELERRAQWLGVTELVLDTDGSHPGAQRLFRRAGFRPIEPFGDNPYAVAWFSKSLPLQSSRWRRQFAACLQLVLPDGVGTPPVPPHEDPFVGWRGWLAARGLGLVPIADAASFAWAGRWIAVERDSDGHRTGARVMFGVPSGVLWSPPGEPEALARVNEGWVLARLDLRDEPDHTMATPTGHVAALLLAARAGEPMHPAERVEVNAFGVLGDRYEPGQGTFSHPDATGTALTLVEAEAIEAALGTSSIAEWMAARRNVVTSGVDLNALVGRRFAVGEVECYGQRMCEPCAHLERLWQPGVLRALVHRGGLRADVLTPGTIAVGAPVRRLD